MPMSAMEKNQLMVGTNLYQQLPFMKTAGAKNLKGSSETCLQKLVVLNLM